MNVLSLFDGISTGQLALQRSGILYEHYFASEIDTYAIRVTNNNFPLTIQIGDIQALQGKFLPEIYLMMGGSPCTGFSSSGKGENFDHKDSKLFFEYARLLKEVKPKYFLLENVRMKKEWRDKISGIIGVEPLEIDSALVSAQRRKRLYWTNIPGITQPNNKNITFGNVREHGVTTANHYYTPKALDWFEMQRLITGKAMRIWTQDFKTQTVESNFYRKYGRQNYFGVPDILNGFNQYRFTTPRECERLQTIPDDYTLYGYEGLPISDTQRYKMIGNAWTVDVIAHILSFLPVDIIKPIAVDKNKTSEYNL